MDDISRKILERIEANTAKTAEQLASFEAKTEKRFANVDKRFADLEEKLAVLVDGQAQLAENVTLLNKAMLRLVQEVSDLRNEKFQQCVTEIDALKARVAVLEKQLAEQ